MTYLTMLLKTLSYSIIPTLLVLSSIVAVY